MAASAVQNAYAQRSAAARASDEARASAARADEATQALAESEAGRAREHEEGAALVAELQAQVAGLREGASAAQVLAEADIRAAKQVAEEGAATLERERSARRASTMAHNQQLAESQATAAKAKVFFERTQSQAELRASRRLSEAETQLAQARQARASLSQELAAATARAGDAADADQRAAAAAARADELQGSLEGRERTIAGLRAKLAALESHVAEAEANYRQHRSASVVLDAKIAALEMQLKLSEHKIEEEEGEIDELRATVEREHSFYEDEHAKAEQLTRKLSMEERELQAAVARAKRASANLEEMQIEWNHQAEEAAAAAAAEEARKARKPTIERVRADTVVSQEVEAAARLGMSTPAGRYRARAVRYYEHYHKDKLATLDKQLTEWHCPDEVWMAKMFRAMVNKYGPEPKSHRQLARTPSIERVRHNTVVSADVAHAKAGSPAARYKARATRFYTQYHAAKLATLDKQLTEWKCPDADMMRKMFAAMVRKYGPEPPRGKSHLKRRHPSIELVHRDTKVPDAIRNPKPGSAEARYKARATRFYSRYEPGKLTTLDTQLTEWRCPSKDWMEKMFAAMVKKYGREPEPSKHKAAQARRRPDSPLGPPPPVVGRVAIQIEQDMRRYHLNFSSVFKVMDSNHDNRITRDEMRHGLKAVLNMSLATEEEDQLFAYFDRDGSGEIDVEELRLAFRSAAKARVAREQLAEHEKKQRTRRASRAEAKTTIVKEIERRDTLNALKPKYSDHNMTVTHEGDEEEDA